MASIATVSVVIPCFNGERYLRDALASVLAQTHADLEVIVVDDGSSDGSLAIARGTGDPRVRVVGQSNAGVAAARNRGAAEARGEYLAFLDQDDLWLPRKLELQLPLFRGPGVGLVYANCVLIGEDGAELGVWSSRYRLPRGRVFDELITHSVVPMSTVLVRRRLFDRLGGFRPTLQYVEDFDLILRVAEHHAIDVVETPVAKYRLHPASVSRRLGLEVAVEEILVLGRDWLARMPERGPALSRALGRYLYVAGKTAFYQGRADLAARYLTDSCRHHHTIRARLFAWLVRTAPRMLACARRIVQEQRGRSGPTPGTFPGRFA